MRLSNSITKIQRDLSDHVILIAVTKNRSVEEINNALKFGITDIGENRIQEAKEKFPHLNKNCKKHLIGHLQKNKVKDAIKLFDYIHSVDSLKLLEKINNECEKQNKTIKIFFQINVSGEESKFGFTENGFETILKRLTAFEKVEPVGLMTIAPQSTNPEDSRVHFKALKLLADRYNLKELSMGMSDDYKVAIEEGATFVRIGRKIFE